MFLKNPKRSGVIECSLLLSPTNMAVKTLFKGLRQFLAQAWAIVTRKSAT